MNSRFARSTLTALVLSLFLFSQVGADVKLRIYLKDGSLQAGNLVKESQTAFVILTKEGRQEIPKDNIMFVNGKSLKQWESRPDKSYSTEILPKDVPDPSFVMDKAKMPTASASKPVIAPVVPLEAKKSTPDDGGPVIQKAEPNVPVEGAFKEQRPANTEDLVNSIVKNSYQQPPQPTVQQQAAEVMAALAPAAPAKKKRRRQRDTAVTPAAPVAKAPPASAKTLAGKPAPQPKADPQKPGYFDRVNYSQYFYQLALDNLQNGERGRAIQNLHLAVILNLKDEQASLLLGKLYMEEGVYSRARKYFNHPALTKKEDVKALVTAMNKTQHDKKIADRILYGATAVGVLLCIPLIAIKRRVSRKKAPKTRVFEADKLVADAVAEANAAAEPSDIGTRPPREIIHDNAMLVTDDVLRGVKAQIESPTVEAPVERPPEPPYVEPSISIPAFEAARPVFSEPVPELVSAGFQPPAGGGDTKTPVDRPWDKSDAERTPPPGYVQHFEDSRLADEALQKGHQYIADEKPDLARREYRTALALKPYSAEAHIGLAYLCFLESTWEQALEHYIRAAEFDPRSAGAHYGIGRVLLEMDRENDAVMEFERALALDPTLDAARDALTALGKAA